MEKSKKRKVLKKSKEGSGKKPNKKKLDKTVVKDDRYDDSSELESDSVHIQKLLEPFPKEQLIEFICDGAIKDPSLFQRIRDTADRDVAHRKIFVHGLAWDTTRETLISAFQSFGEIEDCNIIIDRATGKTKGYGFVLFKNRSGAAKALKQPRKKISNRVTFCQLASVGPVPASKNQDTTGRKIYVSNVHADVDPEKLRSFFEKFGEIETGPLGFDLYTGKSRRYALFVYRTQEGAKKSLEEPCKVFEGNQLLCQMATENKNNPLVQPVQAPVLAAVAAAQNLAIFRQHPTQPRCLSEYLGNAKGNRYWEIGLRNRSSMMLDSAMGRFMFQNTCKTMFESIVFVFVVHPFDVGDRCVIDGVQMIVEEMNILTTIFLRYDMEKIYYPNSILLTKPISNFYRSPDMADTIDFTIDVSTSMETISALKKAIQTYIEGRPKYWHPKHSVIVKEIENVDKMKMCLCVLHTMNHQNYGEKSNRRSELVFELKKIFESLSIKYHLLPQEIHLTQVHMACGRIPMQS